ncbi:hypothetical protein HB370_38415 [Streptomyces sp. DSM 40868]|uniref:DapH/DapD/GlmU-related protein n=1 Tax=Streptomyces TaxID=1883 RepID=UPI000691E220|nr:DapH/DapD/GlmU-related protein [Streptomyces sp. DSM 40868]QIS75116.1 hypothetical protein HB370_38415 [Streptomyces sp. DSM 40868]
MEEIRVFDGVDVRVGRQRIGAGVRIGAGSVIVADELVLRDGVVIEAGCDLRAARIELAEEVQVGAGCRVLAADGFTAGAGTRLDAAADVVCRKLTVGAGTYIGLRWQVGAGASMEEHSTVTVGDGCQLAPDVTLNPTEPITIGNNVGISPQVTIFTHGYHSGHAVREGHQAAFAGVRVEDAVWLGFRCTVLPGVTVGAGTVVAATATVTASLPPGVLAAGVPAKVKRRLEPQALDAAARRTAVEDLVNRWLHRLAYKGLHVTPAGTKGAWQVRDKDGQQRHIRLTPAGGPLHVTVEGRAGTAVFDFGEPLSIVGDLDAVGHDLRDFCRRATWSFPYPVNSTGIVPHRFARLLT